MSFRPIRINLLNNYKTNTVNFIKSYHKNDKMRMSNKLAYLAGLIDGEGWLKVEKHGTIRLVIGMTTKNTIYWIRDNFGGNVSKQKTRKGKPFYVWRLNQGKDLFYVLLLVIPFLVNKRKTLTEGLHKIINKLNAMEHTLCHNYFNVNGRWIE